MKKNNSFILICLLTILSCPLFSQDTDKPKMMGGGEFSFGYGSFPVSDLEAFLPYGFNLSSDHLMFGGGGRNFIGRFVIGGSGFGIIGNEINDDSLEINTGGGYGTFDFGYLVIDKPKFKLYPTLGIGGGGYDISIAERKNISAPQIREDPGQEIEISNGGFILDFRINTNWIPILNYSEDKKAFGGYKTGLQLGFLYQVPSTNWSFSGGDVTNGPDFGLQGFYARLVIGGIGGNQ